MLGTQGVLAAGGLLVCPIQAGEQRQLGGGGDEGDVRQEAWGARVLEGFCPGFCFLRLVSQGRATSIPGYPGVPCILLTTPHPGPGI